MSSGGSKTPRNTTQTTTTIPKFAEPYAMEMLGQAQALMNPVDASGTRVNPYQQYTGQRLAGFTPMQEQGFNNVYNMQTAPQIGEASGLAALAGQNAAGMNYSPSTFQQYQMQQPTDVTTGKWTDTGVASSYMSPYVQNVVERQQRDARRQAGIDTTQRGFRTATSGAYGGNRAALGDFEANRNLSLQLGDIQAKGLQDAYTQGAQQFTQDQGRGLQAGIANQQAGLTAGQANLAALMDTQRLGEQSKQFGAQYGMDALKQQLAAAGVLGGLGNDYYNQQMGINMAQLDAGGRQQALEQAQRDVSYQDFLERVNFPYKQMGFMSDLLHGLPTNQTQNVYGYPNTTGQAIGTLGGLASLYMAGNRGV